MAATFFNLDFSSIPPFFARRYHISAVLRLCFTSVEVHLAEKKLSPAIVRHHAELPEGLGIILGDTVSMVVACS
jgi:hypothetical protein